MRQELWRRAVRLIVGLLIGGPVATALAEEPTPTTLKVIGGTGNWLVASNWNNGVPNSPGAIAIIGGNTVPPVHVTAPVTIGELRLLAPGTQFIGGIGPLLFDNPGDAPAIIRTLVPRNPSVTTSISTPIDIAIGETLVIDVTQPNSLHLQGSIIAAAATIEKHGDGPLVLSGNNTAWGGDLIIREGMVEVAYQDSLINPLGQVVLEPGTTLRLQADMAKPLVIDQANVLLAGSRTLAGPIELKGTATLIGEGGASQPIRLTGPISGEGGWHIGDETQGLRNKTIELSGDNTYLGETVLGFDSDVTVRLLSPTGLGDTSAGTVVYEGPELLLDVVAQEPIVVRGGEVTWRAGSQGWSTPVEMEGGRLHFDLANTDSDFDVSLGGGANSIVSRGGKWGGNIQGTGALTLFNISEMVGDLAHTGPLTISGTDTDMTFNRGHIYDGPTTVNAADVVVNHVDAFGVGDHSLTLKGGTSSGAKQATVTLNETIGKEIVLEGGGVYLRDAQDSYQSRMTLIRGSINIEGAPMAGEIVLANHDLGSFGSLVGGTHEGTITGHGRLEINGTVMNGSGDYRGFTWARTTVVNSAEALGSSLEGTIIWGGRQDFDVTQIRLPIDEPLAVDSDGVLQLHAQQRRMPEFITRSESKAQIQVLTPSIYDDRVEVRLGRIEAHASLTLGELVLHQGGSVETEPGGSVNLIDPHVVMTGGKLSGSIGNLGSVEKVGLGAAEIVDVTNFDGEIELAGGSLALRNVTGSGTARVTQRGAWLGGGGTTSLAVDLTAVTGNFDTPSLKGIAISGEVNLGPEGAFVESATLMGPIVGGDLKADGVAITSDQAAYTGATRVHNSGLKLSHQGRLTTTSEIIIRDGVLRLDNRDSDIPGQPASAESDRVADHIPITLQRGAIEFAPPQPSITERLGDVTLDRGESRIGSYPPAGGPLSELRLTSLTRNEGAVLEIEIQDGANLKVDTPPTLTNGLVGAWATVKRNVSGRQYTDFATYGSSGFRAFTNVHTDISTATASHNVALKVDAVLPAGITAVNSLTMRSDSGAQIDLDLGGQTLAVESGGLNVYGSLSNGAITSGSGSNELVFHGFITEIGATIVDSVHGPTGLTVSGGVHLNAANTFTGRIIVNNSGTLEANHFDAIPDGADLRIDGGSLRTKWTDSEVKSFGNLWLRDGGTIGTGGTGGNRFVEFDEIMLESGTIDRVDLVGDLNIQKVSDGTVTIANQRSQLPLGMSRQGKIDVHEGTLVLDRIDTLVAFRNVPITAYGGTLSYLGSSSFSTPDGKITLHGGELLVSGALGADVHVESNSRLYGSESHPSGQFVGNLSGEADLTVGGRLYLETASPDFSGATTIEGNVELRHAGALGTGGITITPNGSLVLAHSGILSNQIVLQGGELNSQSLLGSSGARVTGDITVSSESSLSSNPNVPLVIEGRLELVDGVRLMVRGAGRKLIAGELAIGSNTTLDLRPGYEMQGGMTQELDIVNGLHLTGLISTTSTNSSVNIVRSGIDEVVLNPSLHAHEGQTLAIRQEGELLPIVIDGPDKVVSGQGTIANNLVLSGGATIASGASPGVLTLEGDLSLGLGSKLAIEVGGTTPGVDYDSLSVGGDLDLSGAILELQFINDFVPEIGQTFQILQAGSLTGMFANATSLYRTAEHAFLVSYENGALGLEATSLPAVAFGDFNSDGLVDAADYIVWRNAVGDTGYDLAADANADAVVNGADYAIWKSHYGSQVPAGAIVAPATVPEPATGLFAVGLLALVSGMRSLRLRKPGC